MEIEKLKKIIRPFAIAFGYEIIEPSEVLMFVVKDEILQNDISIYVESLPQTNKETILKNIVSFKSGIAIPFNPLLDNEKLKAISLLRANTTSEAIGNWGIMYGGGTYCPEYSVKLYEDCLSEETFHAIIQDILFAMQNFENIIKKPHHIN